MNAKISILLISESIFTIEKARSIEKSGTYILHTENNPENILRSIKLHDPKIIIYDLTSNKDLTPEIKQLRGEKVMRGRASFVVFDQLQPQPDLNLGFDDLLYAGFSENELRLRIELTLYKAHQLPTKKVMALGDLVIDEERFEVMLNNRPLDLAFMEYQLLHFLAQHRDRVFTREDLLSYVWGQDFYGGTRTVDVHIRRLRMKLGQEYENYIRTIRNVGYKFIS